MSRKTIVFTVSDKGRDQGKAFLITELPAEDAEEWGAQALFTLMNVGIQIPDNIATQGLAGLASVGIEMLQKVKFVDAKPLFDKMMECVRFLPDASRPDVARPLFPDDIEEVKTRIKLRAEIMKLHVDFFTGGATSISE